MEKLVKENETLHSNIKKWTESIEKAESDIVQNVKDQGAKKEEIMSTGKIVESVKNKLKNIK